MTDYPENFILSGKMTAVHDALNQKLYKKGLTSTEIRRIIKDAVYIVHGDGGFTQNSVSLKLKVLGWRKEVLDRSILDLMGCVAEEIRPGAPFRAHETRLMG